MADNTDKKDFRDKTRINTSQSHEMAYWKKKFNVSSQQLTGAVRAAGTNAKKVEEYLKGKRSK